MQKLVTVVGARPQFIKAGIFSSAIGTCSDLSEIMIHTGQHYDDNLSKIFFTELGLRTPDYNLGIGSGTHGEQVGRMIEGIEAVLLSEKPDGVVVFGDTNSTLAGAIAAAKLSVPVSHIEAGLRASDFTLPEEINRRLCDHCSTLLFAPTKLAAENLIKEGLEPTKIFNVGDLLFDAAKHFSELAENKSLILKEHALNGSAYYLATVHRAENTDNPKRLSAIFETLLELSLVTPIVLPLHPRTRKALEGQYNINDVSGNFKIFSPVGYLDMLKLTRNARLVLTDSGGLQREAYFFNIPSVILREETEWKEISDSGMSIIPKSLSKAGITSAIEKISLQSKQCVSDLLFGDGQAAKKIVSIMSTALRS